MEIYVDEEFRHLESVYGICSLSLSLSPNLLYIFSVMFNAREITSINSFALFIYIFTVILHLMSLICSRRGDLS